MVVVGCCRGCPVFWPRKRRRSVSVVASIRYRGYTVGTDTGTGTVAGFSRRYWPARPLPCRPKTDFDRIQSFELKRDIMSPHMSNYSPGQVRLVRHT